MEKQVTVKFTRPSLVGPRNYRVGDTQVFPESIASRLTKCGQAVVVPDAPKPEAPKPEAPKEAPVQKETAAAPDDKETATAPKPQPKPAPVPVPPKK